MILAQRTLEFKNPAIDVHISDWFCIGIVVFMILFFCAFSLKVSWTKKPD